jgi:hypothetical protein
VRLGIKDSVPAKEFRSEGYRLEEMVSDTCTNQTDTYSVNLKGPLKFEHCKCKLFNIRVFVLIDYLLDFAAGNDEVIKMAERLQGCPIVGPWARD